MASGGYGAYHHHPYYQPAAAAAMPHYYNYNQAPQPVAARGGGGGGGTLGSSVVNLVVFLATLFLFFGVTSLYARCEEAVDGMFRQLRPLLVLSPLLLIAVARLWVVASSADRRGEGALAHLMSQVVADGGPGAGAGASPWGVALVLVLVLLLVSWQSSFRELLRFLPLRRR